MSYTPHTWGHKETITHEKLNNIEEGIQEAAKSGAAPIIKVEHDWNSNSHYIVFALCTYNSQYDCYEAKNLSAWGTDTNFCELFVRGGAYTDYAISPLPVPPEGLYLLVWFWGDMNNYDFSVEGDIEPDLVAVSYGSSTSGFIVTGNCTITVAD
jgi:hypothetical protein